MNSTRRLFIFYIRVRNNAHLHIIILYHKPLRGRALDSLYRCVDHFDSLQSQQLFRYWFVNNNGLGRLRHINYTTVFPFQVRRKISFIFNLNVIWNLLEQEIRKLEIIPLYKCENNVRWRSNETVFRTTVQVIRKYGSNASLIFGTYYTSSPKLITHYKEKKSNWICTRKKHDTFHTFRCDWFFKSSQTGWTGCYTSNYSTLTVVFKKCNQLFVIFCVDTSQSIFLLLLHWPLDAESAHSK